MRSGKRAGIERFYHPSDSHGGGKYENKKGL
jgi:hypothetical protein